MTMPAPDSPRRRPVVSETSAGGLVVDDAADPRRGALIGRIHRRDHSLEWVLPKGHVESGESLEQTAVREVREETGLVAEPIAPLGSLDYWFVAGDHRIHKTVHHFVLRHVSGEPGSTDREVDRVAWVPIHKIPALLRFPAEADLVARLLEMQAAQKPATEQT